RRAHLAVYAEAIHILEPSLTAARAVVTVTEKLVAGMYRGGASILSYEARPLGAAEARRPVLPAVGDDVGVEVEAHLGASLAVADQLQEIAVGIEEVEALVIAPVDGGVVRNLMGGEEALGGLVLVPRDLEGVMALAERVLDLLEAARGAVRLEEERATTLAIGEQHLVVETHPHRHAQHGG